MAKPVELTPAALSRRRRAASRLGGIDGGPRGVADHLGIVQAQDWLGAQWALGLRAPGAREADVRAALDARQFVRAYPARMTVHWVLPDTLRWMLVATAERQWRAGAGQRRTRDLTDARIDAAERIARDALVGRGLDRAGFAAALDAGGLHPREVYHYIVWLCVRGVVAWGPTAEQQQSLILLDEWAPPTVAPPARDESVRRWVLAYLRGHGPAAADDIAWWSGLTLGDVRLGIEAARDDLDEYAVAGRAMWALARDDAIAAAPTVSLLPPFDEAVLSYADRGPHLAAEHVEAVFPGTNGMFAATVLVHGRVAGVWKRVLKPATRSRPATVEVAVRMFTEPTASVRRAIETAVERYARFLDRALVLEVTN